MSNPTFKLKMIETFPLEIELSIPPENPVMRGKIVCDAIIQTKEQVKALGERELEDTEYFDNIIKAVHGLGAYDSDEPLEGQAALDEVRNGRFSMYFLPAIIQAYFEQYGEARRKNSKSLRRR